MNRKEYNHNQQQLTYDVYVGNVPKNINQADLQNLFKAFGEVKQVICRWKEDYFGFGIVKFVYRHDAERVLRDYPEVNLHGHTMPVKTARRSDQSHNENIPIENKGSSYTEMNKNQVYNNVPFSNTDYGYFHPPKYTEEPYIKPPSQPTMLEVLCTSIENAVTFYGCPVSRSEELSVVMNTLRTLPPNIHNRPERKPFMNKMYVALYSADNAWYRCHVICPALPKKQGMCSVRYIDYGNQEDVSYRQILEVPESLKNIPPLASRFVLSNLVCENKLAKKTYLHQLANKRMSLSAFYSPTNKVYHVVKCSCNGKDVIAETISKGFAKPQKTLKHNGHTEQSLRPKAYAHGSEVLLKPNVFNNNNCIPKVQDSNAVYSIKSRPKTEEANAKKEISYNGIMEENKREQEFHPKMIIKRGSELSDLTAPVNAASKPTKEDIKSLQSPSNLLDSVLSNIKLINNVRGLVSKSSDDSIIISAVSLIEELSTLEEVEKSMKLVDSAAKEYYDDLEKIKTCSDQTQLPDLKTKRDDSRNNLCGVLNDYLSSCDNSIFERKDKIQSTITDLESNSNAWMNVYLEKKPSSIAEVISEYNRVKEKRWNLVLKTRENTNQKHKNFMEIFDKMREEFHLHVLEENDLSNSEPKLSGISKPTMYSEKWNDSLQELSSYLEVEIHTLTVKDSSGISIIQCLLAMLDEHKEKIELVCEAYENHFALHNKLSKLPDTEAFLSELNGVRKEIDDISMEMSKQETSEKEEKELKAAQFVSMIKKLHALLLREDYLKVSLSDAAEELYPEIFFYYPDLLRCSKTKSLLKSWNREYFLVDTKGTRGESSFSSELLDDVIDIKEYRFGSIEEVNAFVQKASVWNMIKSESLVKIKALFVKEEEKTVCILLPPVSNTLQSNSLSPGASEGEKACRVLKQILIGLRDLHSNGIIHRSVHPSTILMEGDKALLDFCFDQNYLNGKTNLKNINFQPPESEAMHESADMYAFGCLLLWVLFPNLSFTTENGVPRLAAFRSIIEELILPKDYALLSCLLDANPAKRPSASILLHKGFLSKYESFCKSRTDSQKKLPS